ncbi:DsrE family protein [Onishia taeanensis]
MSTLKVLLHAPTPGSLTRARRNAVNFQAARPDAEVLIVANGGGVAAALETPDATTDPLLRLCHNSLVAQGLENPAGIEEVEAAVVTLAEHQAAGWAYIRC